MTKGEKKPVDLSDVIPIMSKITDHKLDCTNYLNWRQTIELYLLNIAKNVHLTDDSPKDDDSKWVWAREDARLFLQIRNSIDSEVISMVTHYRTVKELMKYLDFLYSGKENIFRIYDVCKAFYRADKGDKTITKYFMDFK